MSERMPKYRVTGFYVSCKSEDYQKETMRSRLGVSDPERRRRYTYSVPDIESLAEELENACNKFDKEGYEVDTILPLNVGSSDEYLNQHRHLVTTSAYSLTRGAMVVAKRRDLEAEG